MIGPVVTGAPVESPVMLIGQAPGDREGAAGRPFAWTAGKTLFKWFAGIGLGEREFRDRIYMAAVCRCFPGKKASGGDRVPSREEIANCDRWLTEEFSLLRPRLVLPVGKLAIERLLPTRRLADAVGTQHSVQLSGIQFAVIPLPHPSGASVWHRTEPGATLLARALALIQRHPAWEEVCAGG